MNGKITASCLCGSVRISCGMPAGPAAYCHCEDCRKCTGSAFNVSVPFEAGTFRVTSGEIGSFAKIADSGNELTRHFCRNCGSPLYTSSRRHPDRVYVKAGILDDPSLVEPAHQSWCQSKVSWATLPPDLPGHERDGR
ncbi:GFA family protein [Labrys sp. LIt4]|nr:GFA family protein [Labrys sp. LIt4]